MSDYTTTAKVELNVNGKQAEETLSKLKQRASDYRDAIAKAAKEGNSTELKQLRNELKSTEREIKSIQSATMNVADVMRRLDSATPKELKLTLKALNRELEGMERGSKAWNEQTEKIRRVKSELDSVNRSLKEQQSGAEKFSNWLAKWQTLAVAASAVVLKVVSSARQTVNAYAEMEQEMANVRKYTGMTMEQVEDLNEELKKMDTRSSREELNKLAQEAGRLGKTSKDDVLGFVRAADQINVALDDLGEGATLTLSKLTGIFGDEERLGTEKSLLAVGSVINELSQNCSASAPYLAEFASRLGGVGAQAGMTIQQIMGYAAVLDSNNQKVEASATALSQVITRLYQDPAKYAKPAGLEVQSFANLLRNDANAALILLLESLNKMGNMDVLSPIFAEMGENGSRAISALSTLAGNIDEVKKQQEVANSAFKEATSIGKEFDVQNNTVQAGLDKAKKKINELAVALGKELLPIMQHVNSSTSAIMQVLLTIISFIKNYKDVIVAVTASILAYNIAVHASAIKTTALAVAQGIAKAATIAWTVVTQAAATVTALFTLNLHKTKIEFALLSGLLKASPIGLLVAGITATVAGLAIWITRGKQLTNVQKAIKDVTSKVNSSIADEKTKIQALIFVAENERISMNKRLEAVNKLNAIIPGYNAMIDKTTGKYKSSKTALDAYLISLEKKIRYEANMNKLTELISAHEQAVNNRENLENELKEERTNADIPIRSSAHAATGASQLELSQLSAHARLRAADKAVTDAYNDVEAFKKLLNKRLKKGELDPGTDDNDGKCPVCHQNPCVCPVGGGSGDTDKKNEDRFKAEKEWREREEALNDIAYSTGEHDYEQYMIKKAQIQAEYYEQILERADLTENERLTNEAKLYASLKEEHQAYSNFCVAEEEQRYKDAVSHENQRYLNGQTSYKAYTNALELMELDHLRRMVQLTEEGSKERAEAEKKYQDKVLADKLKKQKEAEAAIANAKKEFFGTDDVGNQTAYDASVETLKAAYNQELTLAENNAEAKLRVEEAYQKALIILREKYKPDRVDSDTPEENSYIKGVKQFDDWMRGDGGQAVLGTMELVSSGMSGIFSSMSSMVQAELEIQTAAIEKRYDKEIAKAEGNSYKVAKLEKQKEQEIAKAKNEAGRKQYAMQVIQTIAQTAIAGLNAYSSTLAIPLVGPALAPAAMALAIATGMLQVVALKKQQQAAAAQGYASGGFTPEGGKYEPAGIVHKGEWVASQELLASPVARPMIEALDYAQRTNTIGSLRGDDVSRSVMASTVIASSSDGNALSESLTAQAVALAGYAAVIGRLNERLDEPFVTVNTVTGDAGIKKAQDDYDKLIRNKTPKSKRKNS